MWLARAYKRVFLFTLVGYASGFSHEQGIAAQGITGGLVIPSAYVLPDQAIAFGYGNYSEPAFTNKIYRRISNCAFR